MRIPDCLFELPVCPSPRLAWKEKHGISTFDAGDGLDEPWGAATRKPRDVADGIAMEENGELFWGATEDEAMIRLAQRQGWPLWNQTQPATAER